MQSVLHFKRSKPSIGLLVRQRSQGPERTLIDSFVNELNEEQKGRSGHRAIFREPLIDTGYPDVVVAEYDPRVYDRWTSDRSLIGNDDLKVLHFLFHSGGATSKDIEKKLGFLGSTVMQVIEALLDAKLIRRYARAWQPLNLEQIFALKSIMAVEGKMYDMRSAFHQAIANQWFASESYVLTPAPYRNKEMHQTFTGLGIGLLSLCDEKIEKIHPAKRLNLPHSYASWVFNEWVGRQTHVNNIH